MDDKVTLKIRWSRVKPRIAQICALASRPLFADEDRPNLAIISVVGGRFEIGTLGAQDGVRFALTADEASHYGIYPEVFFIAQPLVDFYSEIKKIKDDNGKTINGMFTVTYEGRYWVRFVSDGGVVERILEILPYVDEGDNYLLLPQAPIFNRFLEEHTLLLDNVPLLKFVTTVRHFIRDISRPSLNYDPKRYTLSDYILSLRLAITDDRGIRFVVPESVHDTTYLLSDIDVHMQSLFALGKPELERLSRYVINDFDGIAKIYLRRANTFRGRRPAAFLILSPHFEYRLPLRLVDEEEIREALR
jgi:hypothetical protein